MSVAIRRRKDLSGLAARTRVSVFGEHDAPSAEHSGLYYQVFLWANRQAMLSGGLPPGYRETVACVCPEPTTFRIDENGNETVVICGKKVGEIHFFADGWNLDTVVHESLHAVIGAARWIGPKLAELDSGDDIDQEEIVCYRLGRMTNKLYRWLWKNNPNPRWKREKAV